MKNYIKSYGTYHSPVKFRKMDGNVIDTVAEVYEVGANEAMIEFRKWNGRSWNLVRTIACSKEEANNIVRRINKNEVIDAWDYHNDNPDNLFGRQK